MINNYIILPVVMHMVIAIFLIFCWRKVRIQQITSIIGNILIFCTSILLFLETKSHNIMTMQAGDWAAPFGITFVSDVFSSLMVLLTSVSGLAVVIFSTIGISKARIQFGFFPILHFLLMGLSGAFLTGDIFNLYVWFEIIIISSFVLLTLGGEKPQIEGAINYVAMNMLASMIFLTAIGILYGLTGTLNMADLSHKVQLLENKGLVNVTALLFFVGFGIKSAVFPLYFWLPSSYNTPPSAIAAIFAGLLTKVGIYALFRIFTLIFVPDAFIIRVFLVVASLTLLTGAFGAVIKRDMRKMFSYLIVCHIGYMLAGLGMYTEMAIAGGIFYLVHDIIAKTNLFLSAGIIYKIKGTTNMQELGGLYSEYPKFSFLIAVVLFSLVGIPPLSGFWPKINLIGESISTNSYGLFAAIIFASFITLYVISKMWSEVFWKSAPSLSDRFGDGFKDLSQLKKVLLVTPVMFLALISLYIGFAAEHIIATANHIAKELLHPENYINAVLHNSF